MKKIVTYKSVLKILLISHVLILACFSASAETLRVLTWEGAVYEEHHQSFLDQVKEKYGIDLELEFTYVSGYDDFFPALRDGAVDVVTPDHPIPKDERFQLIKLNLVLPLNLDNIPNYKYVIPSLQQPEYWTEGGETYGIPAYQAVYGLGYNTAFFPQAPTSWNVLWDPQYAEKYVVGEAQYEQNVYITALAMGLSPDNIGNYRKVNTPEFQEKLGQLARNAHRMWVGVDTAEDLKGMAVGAVWGLAFPGLEEMGEVWKMAEPQEGSIGLINTFMISHTLKDKPELKQIVEEWFNYILSDEIQILNVREILVRPITTTVKEHLTPEEVAQFHLDDPDYFDKNIIMFPILGKTDRKGLQRLWDKALRQRK